MPFMKLFCICIPATKASLITTIRDSHVYWVEDMEEMRNLMQKYEPSHLS